MNGNRNSRLRLLCLGALIAATPLTLLGRVEAQDAKPEAKAPADTTPRSWSFTFKKGDVSKYRNRMALALQQNGGEINLDVKQLIKDEVKNTTDEGEGSIEMTFESNEYTLGKNGPPVQNDPAQNPIITRTVNKSGVIVKRELKNVQMGFENLIELTVLILNTPAPAKPVKIGDSWKTDLDNPFLKDKKTTLTSTLVGVEKVVGIETLKIKTEYTLAMKADAPEKDAAKVTGSYNIDSKTGRIVRLATNVDNMEMPVPMGTVKLKMEQKTTLIVPGVNDKEDKDEKESAEKK